MNQLKNALEVFGCRPFDRPQSLLPFTLNKIMMLDVGISKEHEVSMDAGSGDPVAGRLATGHPRLLHAP